MSTLQGTLREAPIGIFQPSSARLARLGAWFEAEYAGLVRFAYFVTGDTTIAEDLVQDAFVKIYRAGGRVDSTTLRAYARTTIVNLSRTRFVRRRRERAALGSAQSPAAVAPHDAGARDEMWRALAALSPRQRACVALRFYEDMSERDIASTLGMSVGSVKQHTNRALRTLRHVLGRES